MDFFTYTVSRSDNRPFNAKINFRHAGVDRLPAHSRGAHRDLKFCSLPKFQKGTSGFIWVAKG